MRRHLVTLLLCSASLGCGDETAVAERSTSRPSARTTDAARLDAGGMMHEGGLSVRDGRGGPDAASTTEAEAAADASAAGSPGAAAGDACEGVSPGDDDAAALHAAAANLLTQQTPCGFSSCHTGSSRARAGLRLLGATDLRALLVDKPSCLAPELPLVDGAGGAEALARSWLWLKLAAPIDASGALQSDPAWGASDSCGQDPSEPFGQQMPLTTGPLDQADLAVVRGWICAGAPGPS